MCFNLEGAPSKSLHGQTLLGDLHSTMPIVWCRSHNTLEMKMHMNIFYELEFNYISSLSLQVYLQAHTYIIIQNGRLPR
jgi:hypothetical protein